MEVTAVCSRLLMFWIVLLAAHIQKNQTQTEAVHITVDKLQIFEYEKVSFHCDAPDGSTKLKGISNKKEINMTCDPKTTSTLTCTIRNAYESDSGEYWCETGRGEKSNTVSITVTRGPVILESPAVPVFEGNDVTLRCRTNITNLLAHFYKDDVLMKNSSAEQVIIHSVSKSDEGFYNCSIPGVGASPRSWLSVREIHPVQHVSSGVLASLWVFVSVVIVALLLLGFIRKHRASVQLCFTSNTPTAASHSEEISQTGENSADDANTLTYAVVVTKHRKNKDTASTAEHTSAGLESNHSRKPQEERDKDGPVYSIVNIKATKKGGEKPN